MGLIAEALRLCCKVLGLVGWNATLVDVDRYPFFEGLDVRDEARVCLMGAAHDAVCARPTDLTRVLGPHRSSTKAIIKTGVGSRETCQTLISSRACLQRPALACSLMGEYCARLECWFDYNLF